MLASGVQIEGLQQQAPSSVKKPVYGNRKKKGPVAKDASPAPESRPQTPASAPPPAQVEAPAVEKDDWEASSEDEATPAPATAATKEEDVKSDWDASSDDESAAAPPPPAPVEKKPVEAKKVSKPVVQAPAKPSEWLFIACYNLSIHQCFL